MNVLIEPRFCGPPASGNGGYSCGLLAQLVSGAAEVTLRAPPPLAVPLAVERVGDGVRLWHGDRLIAEAFPAALAMTPPPAPPGYAEAGGAAAHYAGFEGHDFPTCFTCGPARAEHDGLRVFSGRWRDGIVAAPWVADDAFADGSGGIPAAVLWAAIDCPGYWACVGDAAPRPTLLLARMTADFGAVPAAGERCVIIGWPLGAEGRKHRAGTAMFGSDGRLLGQSRQIWIETRRPA